MTAPPPPAALPPPPQLPPPAGPKIFSSETVVVSYDHETSRWGLTDFLICALLFVAVGLAVIVTIAAVTGDSDSLTGPWLLVAVGLPPVAELLYVAWASRAKGQGLARDFRLSFEAGDVRLGLKLFAFAILCASVIVAVWSQLGDPPTATATDLAQDAADGVTLSILAFAFVGATFVPLVEELVFRGLLWSALEKRGHGPVFILVVTSVVFSLFHFELTRSPILFIIGLAFGIGRLRTGRIGASITAHIAINSFAMVGLLAQLGNSAT